MSLFGDIFGYINSGRAANSVSNADIAAEHGVQDATSSAVGAVGSAVGKAYNDVGAAGDNINKATGEANTNLQGVLDKINGNLQPYLAAGTQGVQGLQDYVASKPQFSFSPDQFMNSDAYKFQLAQGQDAIQNKAAAMGLGSGGNVLKDLTSFGQGLASTYYENAFKDAQSQFQTNQNTTLANLGALINTGTTGTQMSNQANEAIGGQQANNTINAANTNASLQQFLASLGLQGATTQGGFSMTGAKLGGDYAVGAGQAHANGINQQTGFLSSGVSDLAGLFGAIGSGNVAGGISSLYGGH